jgi:hypothetical protein
MRRRQLASPGMVRSDAFTTNDPLVKRRFRDDARDVCTAAKKLGLTIFRFRCYSC